MGSGHQSGVAKGAVAILAFCAVLGSWSLYRRYAESHAPLPGVSSVQGPCVLWFIGSSSMARWSTLERDMQPWRAQNRGIEAATYPEILRHFSNEREAAPQAIILYAGENDLAEGMPLRAVVGHLASFLDRRRALFGDVPVFLLSMKPSPKRKAIWGVQQQYNAAAQVLASRDSSIHYVDISGPLIRAAADADIYRPDRVHMNPKGYVVWADTVLTALDRDMSERVKRRCGVALPDS